MTKKRKKITGEQVALLLLITPFVLYATLWSYVTLFGWSYAFVDFRVALGINPFIHEFVGLKYFKQIFVEQAEILRVIRNTLAMSFIGLACSPLSPLLAILFMEVKGKKMKRVTQTVTTFPAFISWVIVFGVAWAFFSNGGVVDNFMQMLGFPKQSTTPMGNVDIVWSFQTLLGVWKGIGWGAIIYVAAISGIDESLYEAAKIDGASKFKCILHITVPGIRETFIVLFLFSVAGILNTDFEKQLVFMNPMVTSRLMGIDFYVYRIGIYLNQYSFGLAVGISKSIIGVFLLFVSNYVAKIVRGYSMI